MYVADLCYLYLSYQCHEAPQMILNAMIRNVLFYLHKQTAANNLIALSGGLHSGKKGLAAYSANVNATMACVVG